MFIQSLLLTVKAGFLEKTPYDMLPLEEVREENAFLVTTWVHKYHVTVLNGQEWIFYNM